MSRIEVFLQADPDKKYIVSVYQDESEKMFLQNGQYSLVASCIEGREIGFETGSVGFPLKPDTWQEMKNVDIIPAKERLKRK